MLDRSPRAFARPGGDRRLRVLPLLAAAVAVPATVLAVVPASAAAPEILERVEAAQASSLDAQLSAAIAAEAQTFRTGEVATESLTRDRFRAPTMKQLRRQRLEAAGLLPLSNPPMPSYSLSRIVQIAKQYYGTPYVYGGSTPAGFDCSGFTAYVYAKVGVTLPHGSASQGAMTRITASAARPGDLVVMDGGGHVGIYAGNGMMIDAPYAGKTVGLHAIYASDAWFVRPGV